MAKINLSNKMLSKYYWEDGIMLDFGPKQKEIAKNIRECKTSFYDHYVKHGALRGLDSKANLKGISLRTLNTLENIIKEKLGTADYAKPDETIRNKSQGFMIKLRPYMRKE